MVGRRSRRIPSRRAWTIDRWYDAGDASERALDREAQLGQGVNQAEVLVLAARHGREDDTTRTRI